MSGFLEQGIMSNMGVIDRVLVLWDNGVLENIGMEVGELSISCQFKNAKDAFLGLHKGV